MGFFIQYGVIQMKDEIVFALYKDTAIGSKDEFRKKVKKYLKDINFDELFIRITNYQIDTYGLTLTIDVKIPSREDRKKATYIVTNRKQALKKYYENKEMKNENKF